MIIDDINKVEFERSVRGYKMQEVDEFLVKIVREFEALTLERDSALAEKDAAIAEIAKNHENSEKKLYILAEKIEQYRNEEEMLKTALLNAQRLGDSVVQEAKQNAENIVKEANLKATRIYDELKTRQNAEEARLMKMKSEITKFRADILNMYKNHIEQLNTIPSFEEKKVQQPAVVQEAPVAPQPEEVKAVKEETTVENKELPEVNTKENSDLEAEYEVMPSPVNVPEKPLPTSVAGAVPAQGTATDNESFNSVDESAQSEIENNEEEVVTQTVFEEYEGIKFD